MNLEKLDAGVKALWERVRSRDSYWIEKAKLDVGLDIRALFERSGLSRTEFAEKIGKSPAYITKIFRGDVNFTIESMVKLTRALDGQLYLGAKPADQGYELAPSYRLAVTPSQDRHRPLHQHVAWLDAVSRAQPPDQLGLRINASNNRDFDDVAA